MSDKRSELLALGRLRQATRRPGYYCIGDYHRGAYECEWVSPYTKSACNVDATLMVLLQDWSSHDRLKGPLDPDAQRLGYTASLQTNKNLAMLLREHFDSDLHKVFATNVFPFVKPGKLTAKIPEPDLERAAREFALPQIKIVSPRVAVCLGKAGFNAVRVAAGRKEVSSLEEAIASPFILGSTEVWCQSHTGAAGTNIHGGGEACVKANWAKMAKAHKSHLNLPTADSE